MHRVINELKSRYAITEKGKDSPLEFLNALDLYMSLIHESEVLTKIIALIKKGEAAEAIMAAQEQLENYMDPMMLERLSEEEEDHYPVYAYEQLKNGWLEFKQIKHYQDIREFKEAQISVFNDFKKGSYNSKSTGSALLAYAQYSFPDLLTILHTQIIHHLECAIKRDGTFSNYFDFDSNKGLLFFKNKEILIDTKKVPTNAHYLLEYLFSNSPFQKHFYDELEEKSVLLEERPWKSYYDASLDIQKKVEIATGIPDFLDFSSGKGLYVRINPKYSFT
jgi:hypothetical protein